MRFEKSPQLPGAGRTRAGHHHGSHTPTSPGAISQVKWLVNPDILAASVTRVRQNLTFIHGQLNHFKFEFKFKMFGNPPHLKNA